MTYRRVLLFAALPALTLLVSACSGGGGGDTTAPLPPALVATIPTSPSVDPTPSVRGNAEAGARVRLYREAGCSGGAIGEAIADGSGVFVIAVTVPLVGNTVTNLQATATDAAGNASACSTALAYEAHVPPLSFAAPLTIGVGQIPFVVTVGHVNDDGNLDIVTGEFFDTITIRLGNGDGTFNTVAPIGLPDQPLDVAIADVNDDSAPDLVVAREPGHVSVLLADGNGGFGTPNDFTVGERPEALVVVDLNADGFPDIVTANGNDHNLSVLLGDGNGGFSGPTNFPGVSAPQAIVAGDLNGDGLLDVATADRSGNRASVLLGDGNGGFGPSTHFSLAAPPASIAIGDLNGDGSLDLAVLSSFGHVSVLLGDGNGGFGTPTLFPVGATGHLPNAIVAGDLNGDGRLDLAVSSLIENSSISAQVFVLRGKGDGTFEPASPVPTGGDGPDMALGDVNGDGRLDMVVTNTNLSSVSVILALP